MPALIKAVVSIPAQSEIPEDAAQNTFYFSKGVGLIENSDLADITLALEKLYGVAPTGPVGVQKLAYFMSAGSVGAAKPRVDFYNTDQATGETGSPIGYGDLLSFVPGTSTPIPSECSVALSFHGALTNVPEEGPLDTRPAARRRGRIFLPFLGLYAVQAATSGARVDPWLLASGALAMKRLANDSVLSAKTIAWSVYSKKGQTVYPVVGGHMDDAFDTQRRRGLAPSYREIWTL